MKKTIDNLILYGAIAITALFGVLLFVDAIIDAVDFSEFGIFLRRFAVLVEIVGFGVAAIIAQLRKQRILALTILTIRFLPWAIEFPRAIIYGYSDFTSMLTWVEFIALLLVVGLIILLVFAFKEKGMPKIEAKRPMLEYLPLFIFLGFFSFVLSPQETLYLGLALLLAIFLSEYIVFAILLIATFAAIPFDMLGTLVTSFLGAPGDAGTWLEWIFGIILLGGSIFYLIAAISGMPLPFFPKKAKVAAVTSEVEPVADVVLPAEQEVQEIPADKLKDEAPEEDASSETSKEEPASDNVQEEPVEKVPPEEVTPKEDDLVDEKK